MKIAQKNIFNSLINGVLVIKDLSYSEVIKRDITHKQIMSVFDYMGVVNLTPNSFSDGGRVHSIVSLKRLLDSLKPDENGKWKISDYLHIKLIP